MPFMLQINMVYAWLIQACLPTPSPSSEGYIYIITFICRIFHFSDPAYLSASSKAVFDAINAAEKDGVWLMQACLPTLSSEGISIYINSLIFIWLIFHFSDPAYLTASSKAIYDAINTADKYGVCMAHASLSPHPPTPPRRDISI